MYEVFSEERLVSVKFDKALSLSDIENYAEALRMDPLFDPRFSEIVDLTGVEEIRIEASHAMELADKIDPFSLSAKRAFVVRSEAQLHAARLHQLLRGAVKNIQIFTSVTDARTWLAGGDTAAALSSGAGAEDYKARGATAGN